MTKRVTPGFAAGVALALLIAALPGFLLTSWMPWALLVASLLAAAIAFRLWATVRREQRRRRELQDLLERVAEVGDEVVALRRGPTLAAWLEHTEGLLAAAVGESAAAEALRPPPAVEADAVLPTLDPLLVASGFPYGGEFVANLRSVTASLDEIPLVGGFKPSAWSPFDHAQWEQQHARPIAWELNNGGACPWCRDRVYPTSGTCSNCGAQVGAELAFK